MGVLFFIRVSHDFQHTDTTTIFDKSTYIYICMFIGISVDVHMYICIICILCIYKYIYSFTCSCHISQRLPPRPSGGNVRTIDTELTQARRSLDRMIAVAQRNRMATLPGLTIICTDVCW